MSTLSAQQPEAHAFPASGEAQSSPLLIDQFLPRYDFAVVHAQVFRVPPEVCLRAARNLDLLRHPLIRVLLQLRALPQRAASRLTGRRDDGHQEAAASFRREDMTSYGWDLLGENPSEVVLGQIGHPWKAAGAAVGPVLAPTAWATYDEPGYAKIALSLRVDPRGATASILTMETRVALTDAGSLRRFRRYWMVIGPFSDLIRRTALRLLDADLRPPEPARRA
ncbi:MAG TPA: hypothetical protein VLS53_02815 [Candidatus Dormibacteraeota bacterium]|nr:hypothetical protein [Candidatus Dormibacteraeota bacterium]